jgi:NADH-quinone oxidoreductase subunit E
MNQESFEQAEAIVEKWRSKKGNLIMILHDVQDTYGYIPGDVARRLARSLHIPLARIYEVLTFYHYFKLSRPGRYKISVCMGTACYLKGSPEILHELRSILTVAEGQTTRDGLFYLESVRCLGCCGLSPVLSINETVYGNLKKTDVVDIISKYSKEA